MPTWFTSISNGLLSFVKDLFTTLLMATLTIQTAPTIEILLYIQLSYPVINIQ